MPSTFIFVLGIVVVLAYVTDGTHFFGGTVTWHLLNASATGSPVAIVITQTYLWTFTSVTCTSAMIASNQLVPTSTTGTLNCILNCGAASTGYVAPSIVPFCTDISAPVGVTVGQRSDTVYLQSGDDFWVAFQNRAWRNLSTASMTNWSISSHINVTPRPDNGLYNNAPVATMMSPINIPVNQSTAITVPVGDADGDLTRCRWANGTNECGGVCPPASLPPNTVIYPNCTILITGDNVGNWYAVTLMVEDFINASSTTPLSTVPVQFLVQVIAPPLCSTPPQVIGLPVEQSCTSVVVNQTFTSQLIAINNCGPNVTIDDIATLSFSGMIQSNITKVNSTIFYKTLSWTPSMAQLGYQVMCAMAFDSEKSQSPQYCFKFYVSLSGVCACPGSVCIPTTSTTSATTTTISSTTETTTTTTDATTTTETSTSSAANSNPPASTSTSKNPQSINWPLIGSIIGLVLLGSLALITCLLCRYCCGSAGGSRRRNRRRSGTFDFYHIEPCTDSSCVSSRTSRSPKTLSVPSKSYGVYDILEGSTGIQRSRSRSNTNSVTPSCSSKYEKHSGMSDFHRTNGSFVGDNRTRRKSTAGVSVSRIDTFERPHTEGNVSITERNRQTEKEHVIMVPIGGAENGSPELRLGSALDETRARRKSTGHVSVVRLFRVVPEPTKPSGISSQCTNPLIAENTVQPNDRKEMLVSRPFTEANKTNPRVTRLRSVHTSKSTNQTLVFKIESIELPLINSTLKTSAAVLSREPNSDASLMTRKKEIDPKTNVAVMHVERHRTLKAAKDE